MFGHNRLEDLPADNLLAHPRLTPATLLTCSARIGSNGGRAGESTMYAVVACADTVAMNTVDDRRSRVVQLVREQASRR